MRTSRAAIVLSLLLLVSPGCQHPGSGQQSEVQPANVEIERPESSGSVNVLLCTIMFSDQQTCTLLGGEHAMVPVRPGTMWLAASSPDPYAAPDSGYPVAWRSRRFRFHVIACQTLHVTVQPRSKGNTYVGGWAIKRAANNKGYSGGEERVSDYAHWLNKPD